MHKKTGFTPLKTNISNRASKRFLTGPVRSRRLTSNRAGFTLIELLVVISIIALLMSILMPALHRARNQAKSSVCMTNLHHWGAVFQMYTDDNNGYFMGFFTGGVEHWWPIALKSYYINPDLRLCPMATLSWFVAPLSSFHAWDFRGTTPPPDDRLEGYEELYGSYGINEWIGNVTKGEVYDPEELEPQFWRTANIKGAAEVPMLLDSNFIGGFPEPADEPPEYEGLFDVLAGCMTRYCIDRHNAAINGAFVDCSVRKIGLKQLWTLKWHRTFDTQGPWTKAGNVRPQDWPNWMRKLPEY